MNQEELIALVIAEVDKLGIDYRPFDYNNQKAWIDARLYIGATTRTQQQHLTMLTNICMPITKIPDEKMNVIL